MTIQRPISAEQATAIAQFAERILHGDETHRHWLKQAALAFIDGRPVPPPTLPAADGGWRPISEEPEESGFYLCWCPGAPPQSHRIQVARWTGEDWLYPWEMTHWQPLPPPPVPQSAEDEG